MKSGQLKQLEVQIMQQTYLLSCPPGQEERLRAAVARVDAAMTHIREAGKLRARERIAVLAAVNLAFEMLETGGGTRLPEPVGGHAQADTARSEKVESLVQRIDELLSRDGQLL